MPGLVVLSLCTAFVLYLLQVEWRCARENSLALWIPTIWMLIIASRPLVDWIIYIGPGGVILENDSGSAIDRWVLIVLAIAAIVVLVNRRVQWWAWMRQNTWFLALLAYMFFSTFWSDITLIAMKRWIREFIVPIMAFVIVSDANPLRALESIFRRVAYILLPFSIVLIKYFPTYGVRFGKWSGILMWVGVTGQKNQLGRLCAISIIFLLFTTYRYWRERKTMDRAIRRRDRTLAWADAGIALLGFYLLRGSESSTSLVSLILGIAVFAGLQLLRRWKLKTPRFALYALLFLLMTFGVATPFVGGANVAHFTGTLGRDDTLTGRTQVWADVMPARELHPLLGYGYGSFWTDARRALYDIPTSHNGYLDILLEMGEVGLVFFAAWLLSCVRQMHLALNREYEWASLGLSFLFMGLLYNTTESAINSLSEHMTAVTVFSSMVLSSLLIAVSNRVRSREPLAQDANTETPVLQAAGSLGSGWSSSPWSKR
jgi:exopolysaccharide production protein ExoQ